MRVPKAAYRTPDRKPRVSMVDWLVTTAKETHEKGYIVIPSRDGVPVIKTFEDLEESWPLEAPEWNSANMVSIVLREACLLDYDGNKGKTQITPEDFLIACGLPANRQPVQSNRAGDSLHWLVNMGFPQPETGHYAQSTKYEDNDLKRGAQLVHLKFGKTLNLPARADLPPATDAMLRMLWREHDASKPEGEPLREFDGVHYLMPTSALTNACQKIRNAPSGNRNNTLSAEAIGIFKFVSGGVLDDNEAWDSLFAAARDAGLDDDEISKSMGSARTKGFAEPRDSSGKRIAPPAPPSVVAPANDELDSLIRKNMPDELPDAVKIWNDAAGWHCSVRAGYKLSPRLKKIVDAIESQGVKEETAVDAARAEVAALLDVIDDLDGWSVNRETGECSHADKREKMRGPLAPLAAACLALRQALVGEIKQSKADFRTNDKGRILDLFENMRVGLSPAYSGVEIGYDDFQGEIMITPAQTVGWRPIKDTDYTRLREKLQQHEVPCSKDKVIDIVETMAEESAFDSAQTWLNGLEWDGVPRVNDFCHKYLGTSGTAYTKAVSLYLWSALAGRILQPGIKADMVPVLVGDQGLRKTSAVAAMVPAPDYFTELNLSDKDDDQARKLKGSLIAELGELRGMTRTDQESLKSFITRNVEKWIPKFKEHSVLYHRRCVFIGTTNNREFLADPTGARRWLPMDVHQRGDTDGIIAVRDQLWAEGAALFREHGILWQDAERLAKAEHEAYRVSDLWEVKMEKWLNGREEVTTLDALHVGMGIDINSITKKEERRMANVLRALGYSDARKRTETGRIRVYVK